MRPSSLLAAIGILTVATATYYDSITGYSLLGSHFGVPGFDATYDYVVVGGGTTGLALATRLAQQGNQVAVVEGGGFYETDNGNLTQIPGKAAYFIGKDPLLRNPFVDWGIETTPQVVSNAFQSTWTLMTMGKQGLLNAVLLYTQGKVFGGSSARNYLLYQRYNRVLDLEHNTTSLTKQIERQLERIRSGQTKLAIKVILGPIFCRSSRRVSHSSLLRTNIVLPMRASPTNRAPIVLPEGRSM